MLGGYTNGGKDLPASVARQAGQIASWAQHRDCEAEGPPSAHAAVGPSSGFLNVASPAIRSTVRLVAMEAAALADSVTILLPIPACVR